MRSSLLFICTIIFLVSCDTNKTDKVAEGEQLMLVSREWSKAVAAGNIDTIMSYWADTAVFFSNYHPPLRGKNEIRNMVEQSSQIPGFSISWEPISVSVSESGDMAYLIEQNKVVENDSLGKPVITYGKAVTIWKKDADGKWKNVVEIGVNDSVARQ